MGPPCYNANWPSKEKEDRDKERKKKKIKKTALLSNLYSVLTLSVFVYICTLVTAVNVLMLCSTKYSSILSLIPSTTKNSLVQISVTTLHSLRCK